VTEPLHGSSRPAPLGYERHVAVTEPLAVTPAGAR
jgi:hypothetical protein